MDHRLRELERQAINDPVARTRWIEAMKQIGHRELLEQVGYLDIKGKQYGLEQFQTVINDAIAKGLQSRHHKNKRFHRFELAFNAERDSCCGHYDCFCDFGDVEQSVTVVGYRFETEKEKKAREKQETDRQRAIERQQRQAAQRAQNLRQQKEDQEMAIYLRVKERMEAEEKMAQLLTALGQEAHQALLDRYSASYYKSWFKRKSKKLQNRSPIEVFDAGETDLLRCFALQQL